MIAGAFYEGEWRIAKGDRSSLLVSHLVAPKCPRIEIHAMPVILNLSALALLLIAEPDSIGSFNPIDMISRTTHDWNLRGLMSKTPPHQSSSIENESNSASQTKTLGVPVVASCVGDAPHRVEPGASGILFGGDAPCPLAHFVMEILDGDVLGARLSNGVPADTQDQHDKVRNSSWMLKIHRTNTGFNLRGWEV